GQQRGSMFPDELLKLRVQRYVALIVTKQVELDLVIPGTLEECGIKRPRIRRESLLCRYAVRVLPARGLRFEEGAQGSTVLGRRIFPVGLDRIPTVAQALQIRVAVLRDDRGDLLRVSQSQSQTDRRAVVEYINCVTRKSESLGESVNDVSEVLEG